MLPEKLLALLRRARLIGPPEVVEPAIKSRIRTDAGPRFLAFHEGQMYWVQMIMTGRKPTGFAVLASHGELVSRVVAREIKRLDPALDGKRLIDTHLRDKLFLTMLDMIPRNLEALTKEVREPLADVREVIQDLLRENVAVAEAGGQPRWKNDRYSLRADLALFLSLARQCLEGPNKFRFLSSQFAAAHLASDVPGYLEARWRFRTTDRERAGLYRFLSVSPSALNHTLFTPTDRYLSSGGGESHRLPRPGTDARAPDEPPDGRPAGADRRRHGSSAVPGTLDPQGDQGASLPGLRQGGDHPRIGVCTPGGFPVGPGQGAWVRPGRAAGRSDSEHAIELGAALMHMEEYEQAVAHFDRGIKEIRDPSRLLTAWNSRGICLLHLKKLTEATTSFNEALRYNGNSKVAWYHKALCLKELGDLSGAQRCCRRALDIDANYTRGAGLVADSLAAAAAHTFPHTERRRGMPRRRSCVASDGLADRLRRPSVP